MNLTALEPGKLYVIEVPQVLSDKNRYILEKYLNKFHEHWGVDFIILDGGMKLAKPEINLYNECPVCYNITVEMEN